MAKKTAPTTKELAVSKEIHTQIAVLPKDKATVLRAAIDPMLESLQELEADYNSVIADYNEAVAKGTFTLDLADMAKPLRLKYRNLRLAVDKLHTEHKEEVLLLTRAIDGMRAQFRFVTKGNEEQLADIENHIANLQKEEIKKLQEEREGVMKNYGVENPPLDLGEKSDDEWEIYLLGTKQQFELKAEAAKKAAALDQRLIDIAPYKHYVTKELTRAETADLSDKAFDNMISGLDKKREAHLAEIKKAEDIQKEAKEREAKIAKRFSDLSFADNDGEIISYLGNEITPVSDVSLFDDEAWSKIVEEATKAKDMAEREAAKVKAAETAKKEAQDKADKLVADKARVKAEREQEKLQKEKADAEEKRLAAAAKEEENAKESDALAAEKKRIEERARELEQRKHTPAIQGDNDFEVLESLATSFREFQIPTVKGAEANQVVARMRMSLGKMADYIDENNPQK